MANAQNVTQAATNLKYSTKQREYSKDEVMQEILNPFDTTFKNVYLSSLIFC